MCDGGQWCQTGRDGSERRSAIRDGRAHSVSSCPPTSQGFVPDDAADRAYTQLLIGSPFINKTFTTATRTRRRYTAAIKRYRLHQPYLSVPRFRNTFRFPWDRRASRRRELHRSSRSKLPLSSTPPLTHTRSQTHSSVGKEKRVSLLTPPTDPQEASRTTASRSYNRRLYKFSGSRHAVDSRDSGLALSIDGCDRLTFSHPKFPSPHTAAISSLSKT